MDILINSFQTYYKLPETNKSFENLLVTLLQFHFEKNTIKNFNNPVEHEDSFTIALELAKNKKLENIYNFSLYSNYYVTFMYPEVIYIVQFLDHIFKHLLIVFKSLHKANRRRSILELKSPDKKYINKIFETNIDIITYLIFLNTDTIPLDLFGTLNRQLKIKNTKYLIFLIDKFINVIKDDKICYITPIVTNEFAIFEQKESPITTSPIKEFTTLLTSKTISPKHKLQAFIHNFIKLSEPIGQDILLSIIMKLDPKRTFLM